MDSALRALADGTRRHILALIWHEERTASEIASEFSISGPAISQHLKVLLHSELVLLRRSGTRRFYRVNQSAIANLQAELTAFFPRWTSTAHLTASTTLGNSASSPSPVFFTT